MAINCKIHFIWFSKESKQALPLTLNGETSCNWQASYCGLGLIGSSYWVLVNRPNWTNQTSARVLNRASIKYPRQVKIRKTKYLKKFCTHSVLKWLKMAGGIYLYLVTQKVFKACCFHTWKNNSQRQFASLLSTASTPKSQHFWVTSSRQWGGCWMAEAGQQSL